MRYLPLVLFLSACGPWIIGDPWQDPGEPLPEPGPTTPIQRCPFDADTVEVAEFCGFIQQVIEEVE